MNFANLNSKRNNNEKNATEYPRTVGKLQKVQLMYKGNIRRKSKTGREEIFEVIVKHLLQIQGAQKTSKQGTHVFPFPPQLGTTY